MNRRRVMVEGARCSKDNKANASCMFIFYLRRHSHGSSYFQLSEHQNCDGIYQLTNYAFPQSPSFPVYKHIHNNFYIHLDCNIDWVGSSRWCLSYIAEPIISVVKNMKNNDKMTRQDDNLWCTHSSECKYFCFISLKIDLRIDY